MFSNTISASAFWVYVYFYLSNDLTISESFSFIWQPYVYMWNVGLNGFYYDGDYDNGEDSNVCLFIKSFRFGILLNDILFFAFYEKVLKICLVNLNILTKRYYNEIY